MVKKIKVMVQQIVDIVIFQNGQCRTTLAAVETQWVVVTLATVIRAGKRAIYTNAYRGWAPRAAASAYAVVRRVQGGGLHVCRPCVAFFIWSVRRVRRACLYNYLYCDTGPIINSYIIYTVTTVRVERKRAREKRNEIPFVRGKKQKELKMTYYVPVRRHRIVIAVEKTKR